MNIRTAIGYVNHGYRVRRTGWHKEEYLCNSYNGVVMRNTMCIHPRDYDFKKFAWTPRVHDLTADDWELILDGIIDNSGTVKYEGSK